MIVVDTNVLVYLLVPCDHTPLAEAAMRRDPDWSAPPLWRSEFRNVLGPRVRRGLIGFDAAMTAFAQAERHLLDREFGVSTGAVLDLVSRSQCTAYDCEFVALAQAQAVPLVTSDAEILREFRGIAVSLEEFAQGQGRGAG